MRDEASKEVSTLSEEIKQYLEETGSQLKDVESFMIG
jgi:hypothetical protein